MEAAVDEGMMRGAVFVLLEVRASNEVAQSLYRKLGFSFVGPASGLLSPANRRCVCHEACDQVIHPQMNADYTDKRV
jgi:ribosomal protein S18 acetylase RimI-like enzyme